MGKQKILIIEDDHVISASLQALLEANGYQVTICNEGISGIRHAQKQPPALLLLDLMLPRVSGFDVCKTLKANELTKDIPVLVITGLGKMADVEKAFSAGAADYIIKPFDNARLMQKIQTLLAKK